MEDYLQGLNPQQYEAVKYTDGPQLVIAGAGSGKTRVLTYKIVHLLKLGIPAYQILALTFTNKAAREMKERIIPLVGDDVAAQLWMGTFHSIFSKILRINADRIGFTRDFTIYDSADSKSLIKMIIKDLQLDEKVYKPSSIQSRISNMKNALISPTDYRNNKDLMDEDAKCKRPLTQQIYHTYWNRCQVAGAMDFDDLLYYTNVLLRDCPDVLDKYQNFFQYILVDEYQDTNFAQHLIISQLSKLRNKVCVVGDDAQSIYSFRGANINNILTLNRFYPNLQTFKLEQNYRSTQTIIDAANSLIEKNTHQIHKHIFSHNDVGNRIPVIQSYSEYEESYVVANNIISLKSRGGCTFDDFAILYRQNSQSRVIEEALRKRNIPYKIYGGLSFYQRKEIKDAVSYFRLALNPNDDEAFSRIVNVPARGIGPTTVDKVKHCALENNVSAWAVINNPGTYGLNVNAGTLKKLTGFATIIQNLYDASHNGTAASEIVRLTLASSGLLESVSCDNTPENISRRENLTELLNNAADFEKSHLEQGDEDISLTQFINEVSLATDQDLNDNEEDGAKVTLMTVHAAKGLEFTNVIIVGVEEELFPSKLSSDSLYGIEEERRLLYVAITRAKKNCVITFASSRFMNGQSRSCAPSRFLRDIDSSYLTMQVTSSNFESAPRKRFTDSESYTSRPASLNFANSKPAVKRTPAAARPVAVTPAPSLTPSFKPISKASAGAGSHSVDEISKGMLILHTRFGKGEILSVDDTSSDARIIVSFENVGLKTLLLKYAKFDIIS